MPMILTKDKKILVVGLGLMGGSYAEALTKAGYCVGGLSDNEDSLKYAIDKGIVSDGRCCVDGGFIGKYDILVFCLYPHSFIKWIADNQHYIRSGALLTDVTGVKTSTVYEIQSILRKDLEFIASHPMAGRESSGIEKSSSELFKGANFIVTPTDANTDEAVMVCEDLGREIGCSRISRLTPEKHDEMIGFLSQLTHCIAVSLMVCKESAHLVDYTGDSFRDLTRIARINENMWPELFQLNKEELLNQMSLFLDKFNALKDAIATDDIEKEKEMMRLSSQRRILFDKEL